MWFSNYYSWPHLSVSASNFLDLSVLRNLILKVYEKKHFVVDSMTVIKERWWLCRATCPYVSLSHLNQLTFLWNRRETAAWQMCTVVISSVLWAEALFVTSELLDMTTAQTPYSNSESPSLLLQQNFSSAATHPFALLMSSDWSFFLRVCFHSRQRVNADFATSVGQAVLWNTSVSRHCIVLPDSHLVLCVGPLACQALIFI